MYPRRGRQSTGVAIARSSARRPRTKSRNAGIQIGEPTNNAPRRPHGPAAEMNLAKIQIVNPLRHRATAHAKSAKEVGDNRRFAKHAATLQPHDATAIFTMKRIGDT